MAENYRELMEEISPAWLMTRHGKPFMQAIGTVKDSLMFRALEAVRIRFPKYSTADALAAIGAERNIPRAVGESLESYAGRVRGAWASWLYAGTARGMLRAFYDSGYTNVSLAIFNGRRYTLDADRNVVTTILPEGSWKFDVLGDTFWSRFIVLFPEPLIQRWQDDGVPASNSDEAGLIRGLVRRWKPAHMQCAEIAIATSAIAFDYFPDGTTLDAWGRATLDTEATNWTHWSA